MSVRMRHNRSHTGNRRSHHKAVEPQVSTCENCGSKHLRHHVCRECGQYRGRVVLDVTAKIEKKEEKRKQRQNEMGASQGTNEPKDEKQPEAPEEKEVLSPEAILRK